LLHRKALRNLIRYGDLARLDQLERKSLTSFSFGANSFILAPEMSSTVLSCLFDDTDLAGLVDNQTISAASPPAGTHHQPTQRRGHCSQDGDCSRKLLRNLALKSTVSERAAKQIEIGGFGLKSNRR
jgi:hypothetical protein